MDHERMLPLLHTLLQRFMQEEPRWAILRTDFLRMMNEFQQNDKFCNTGPITVVGNKTQTMVKMIASF